MAKDLTAEQRERRERRDARRAARETSQKAKNAERREKRTTYQDKYATDADRGLVNPRGGADRRQERRDTWNQDGFDVNTFGKGHVSGQEMKRMRQDGMSSSDIEGMTDGMYLTARATKQLNRKKAREKARAVQAQTPEEVTAPTTPAPVVNPGLDTTTPGTPTPQIPPSLTNPEPGIPGPKPPSPPTISDDQIIGGDTGDIGKTGDMTTTIGDGNTIIGSPIGNDYSVTIGNTGNMDGGGSGLSNMMGAAAYSALNDNAYAKSQSQLNGYGRAQGAIAQGELATGASDRVAALYNTVGESQKYWNNKANAQQGLYLGDVWNQGGHEWVQAPDPKSSEDRTSEILDDDDD